MRVRWASRVSRGVAAAMNMNLRSGKDRRGVWPRTARTGNGDAGEAERFAGVVFVVMSLVESGSAEAGLFLGSGPPRAGPGAVEERECSLHVVTNGVVELVQVLVHARRSHFRIVGHLLKKMDADALHFDGDDLSVQQRALEEPALIVDLIALEADKAALGYLVSAGLADRGQHLTRDPFSEAFRFRLSAREDQTIQTGLANGEHLLLPARGTNISFSALVLLQSADGHAGVFKVENFAHVLGD